MIKWHRAPSLKYLLTFLGYALLILGIFVYSGLIKITDKVIVTPPILETFVGCLVLGAIVTLGLFHRHNKLIFYLNSLLKGALQDRHLALHMEVLHSAKTWRTGLENTYAIFKLFRAFDLLKSAKISDASNTFKTVIGIISEGIVVLNKDHVVIAINEQAESLLKLRPAEALFQHFSRKVSSSALLSAIEEALNEGNKVPDIQVIISEKLLCSASVTPIKNKGGDVIRLLILLEDHKETPKIQEEIA